MVDFQFNPLKTVNPGGTYSNHYALKNFIFKYSHVGEKIGLQNNIVSAVGVLEETKDSSACGVTRSDVCNSFLFAVNRTDM
jgi:hypothetical protein